MTTSEVRSVVLCFLVAVGSSVIWIPVLADPPRTQSSEPFNDVPKDFKAKLINQDYSKRVEMIPMRDGVKLQTFILIPKGAHDAPILLTRTPYNAKERSERTVSASLRLTLHLDDEEFAKAGYIRVYQDVRGKYGSEGDYVMARPVRGALNPTPVDHTTDAWDTIDWLVKNLPESNGRVGMIGSSYEGFTVVMALLDPHPALKAAVPESPLADGWMGDDWFHYGAFRNTMLGYIHWQTGQRGEGIVTPREYADDYEEFLRAGSTGDYVRAHGLDQLPWVVRTMAHPAYDAYWQGQDLVRLVAAHPSSVPTLWEQGLWDQEDMWGANHAWLALKAAGHEATNWLILGPWYHSQIAATGYSLGPLLWEGDTTRQYHHDMVLPFFNQYLRDGPPAQLARVTVYNTGENRWEQLPDWPSACERGCAKGLTPLYLSAGFGLSFDQPAESDVRGDSYISDPARPVPFLPRPFRDPFADNLAEYGPWATWLVDDQRFVDGRTDVLVYETPVLTSPIRVRGVPVADIRATTTGSDGDFVVKLIDVYPSEFASNGPLGGTELSIVGGYELPIALDIFRGRYRESFENPAAIPPNVPQRIHFSLPEVDHVFLPGHRVMVQIQSTLFPLYDRNPQTYVPNIFNAKPSDYQKAEITILRSKRQPTAIWLPVLN
jgi:putative CocE/NonD family hydrolase